MGVLAREEMPSAMKALVGYQKAAERLATLGDRLSSVRDGSEAPGISMVLIGPMLWARFEPTGAGRNVTVHVDGPRKGDVVVVTDEPVIAALTEGRITTRAARALGLLRLYGSAQAVEQVSGWFDRLPGQSSAKAATVGN